MSGGLSPCGNRRQITRQPVGGLRQLAQQIEYLIGGCEHLIFDVLAPIGVGLVQVVPIVGHDRARYRDTPRCRIGEPVESPENGSVVKVKVRCNVRTLHLHFMNIHQRAKRVT